MKILFIKSCCHTKNFNFILKCRKIDFTIVNNVSETYNLNLAVYDAVYSPCEPIDVSKYPNTKFIFGPQFSVFPDERLNLIKFKNVLYNLLSDWVINFWNQYQLCDNLKFIKLPFGVDTEKFNEINTLSDREKVFIYFKKRNPEELQLILHFFQNKNIEIKLFNYESRYYEEEYLNYLQNSKYGVWLDAHESQGFALQEALSCNVPLLVWNASSMNQEYGSSYTNFPASTIPYWDERCGEFFYEKEEFEEKFDLFTSNLETYKPREYILENLSIDVCENQLINLIKNM
jgi:glycosyltransferase involved in cell wall biosynthesis